jgi:hypothetical protein
MSATANPQANPHRHAGRQRGGRNVRDVVSINIE